MKWSRRRAVMAALVLVIVTNAIALAGVAFNRHGEPESTLVLSEREVELPYEWRRGRENSGLAVSLSWRVPVSRSVRGSEGRFSYRNSAPAWLDDAKLVALGFTSAELERTATFDRSHRRTALPREVLVVLEMDGPACAQSLLRVQEEAAVVAERNERGEGRQRADEMLEAERTTESRLFAVDAGLDARALRATYPDRSRYAIVHAEVEPSRAERVDGGSGFITALGRQGIQVPLALRDAFGPPPEMAYAPKAPHAHYQTTVAFGQRLEPWLLSAERR